MIYKVKPNQF